MAKSSGNECFERLGFVSIRASFSQHSKGLVCNQKAETLVNLSQHENTIGLPQQRPAPQGGKSDLDVYV